MNKTSIVEEKYLKKVPEIRPGDVVRVHQKIKEGNKERIQVFEGVVLKVKGGGVKMTFLVRKISFGIGVEKNFLIHSPNIAKIEVKKRSKVRKAYLTYLRNLQGKSARLKDKQFDMLAVNVKEEAEPVPVMSGEDKKDAEITELSEEEITDAEKNEESLDVVEKAEEKVAEKEDSTDEGTEQEAEIEEINEGVDKAEAEEAKEKDTEGEKAEKSKEDMGEKEIAEEIKEEKV